MMAIATSESRKTRTTRRSVMPEVQMVSVKRDEFAAFLRDVKAIRGAFLICAPKFGAGSVGEAALTSALRLDPVLRAFEEKLK